jgi:hypothetical protein
MLLFWAVMILLVGSIAYLAIRSEESMKSGELPEDYFNDYEYTDDDFADYEGGCTSSIPTEGIGGHTDLITEPVTKEASKEVSETERRVSDTPSV